MRVVIAIVIFVVGACDATEKKAREHLERSYGTVICDGRDGEARCIIGNGTSFRCVVSNHDAWESQNRGKHVVCVPQQPEKP